MVEPTRPVRLIVLYGGRSAEHEVSCISALHVVGAVDRERYDLRMVGITTAGEWVDTTDAALPSGSPVRSLPSPDEVLKDDPRRALGSAGSVGLAAVGLAGDGQGAEAVDPAAAPPGGSGPDAAPEVVVLPLLHGPMGEDGTVQGLLELAGVPYCGAGVGGSAAAMDKGMAKALLASAGIPQARYMYRRETQFDRRLAATVEEHLGWPVFVKPANMGSSIGITMVKDPGGLDTALRQATRYDTAVVIEEAVHHARELEIGVLGWPDLRTSVPGEIKPSRDFYDFEDKYLEGAAGLEVPAQLPEGVAGEMGRLAVAACEALRVDSMARVDFFYEASGRGLLVNEINTIPGFTPISMYPRLWAASGLPYPELVDTLVEQARRRAARRRRFETGR